MISNHSIHECPYRGLGAFTAEDGRLGIFVGREEETSALREMVGRHALVVVAGPSGVGKSSLVNAGLISTLPDDGWLTKTFRIGRDPFLRLAGAIFSLEHHDREPALDELTQRAGEIRSEGLARMAGELARRCGRSVLLHADQFEEIFDPDACSPAVRKEFLDVLLAADELVNDRLRLVCTLRADFLDQLLERPGADVLMRDGLFALSPMSHVQLYRVIREPAAISGVEVEEGLTRLAVSIHGVPGIGVS